MPTKVITVGNTTVERTGEDTFTFTVTGHELQDRETIELTEHEIHASLESIYTAQRASSSAEWELLPPVLADLYDAIVYTSYVLRAASGQEAFHEELAAMQAQDRFEVPDDQLDMAQLLDQDTTDGPDD